MDMVESFYDRSTETEWDRMDRHRMEFAITTRVMKEYIKPASRILDVGGGPGRYSIHLALAGHKVTLLDLSAGNIGFAERKAGEMGATLDGCMHGNALDLSGFPDSSFDAVLLMGPLYHLVDEGDRKKAISEARRVLKNDGLILAAFLSRFALLTYLLRSDPGQLHTLADDIDALIDTGSCAGSEDGWLAMTHYMHPSSITPFMSEGGFVKLFLGGVEGITAPVEGKINSLEERSFRQWVDMNYRLCQDPVTWGSVEHMLFVGKK